MSNSLPRFLPLRQLFLAPRCDDLAVAIRTQLAGLELQRRSKPGETVAVTAGSRGIRNYPEIMRAVVDELTTLRLQPFVFPCMGSHGGATAHGQVSLLAEYGLTEQTLGAPIRSTMDTVEVGRLEEYGIPVLLDALAAQADHLVLVNRVKPHPCYSGPVQSGLMKMMMIGLGNHRGATLYHRAILSHGFQPLVYATAREVLRRCPVLFGLAILENAEDETADLVAVPPDSLIETEEALLQRALDLMPRLPFKQIDLLVLDEIGKNINGAGMDTNLVGRVKPAEAAITRLYVRDVTPESHGNASGVGWADLCHQRVVDKMSPRDMYLNALTSGYPASVATPIHFATDRECLAAALSTIGLREPQEARVVWVKNTKQLARVAVSEAYADEVTHRPDLEPLSEPVTLAFDEDGQVTSPVPPPP